MPPGRIAALLWILSSAAIATASLSPSVHEPTLEGRELSTDARFARIDSLEVVYPEATGSERAQLGHRLAQLYLSTGLRKHKRRALEHLDSCLKDDPEFFEAARLRASVAHEMRYTREARHWLEDLTAQHPHDWRPYRLLGDFHFAEAKRVMDRGRFEQARGAFLSCVQVDSTQGYAWYGLAACLLALEEFESLAGVAARLERYEEFRVPALFLAGAASAALGRERLADDQLRRALRESPPEVLDVYRGGDGFLDAETLPVELVQYVDGTLLLAAMRREQPDWTLDDAIDFSLALEDPAVRSAVVSAYWRSANMWPSHTVNRRLLRYWRRLVEADVLFGDANTGLRGWQTEMGQAFVRWGRPDFTIYEPPSSGIDLQDWYDRGVRLSVDERIPAQTALWVWTYRREGTWFSLLFTDDTFQAKWRAGSETAANIVTMARSQPLTFFDAEPEPEFYLALETSAFPRLDNTTIESYVEVQPTGAPDPEADPEDPLAKVELAIYDGDLNLMEYVHRDLRDEHRRSQLHASLGAEPLDSARDPLLCQIGASLPPGRYRLAVDVTQGGGHRAMEVNVTIPSPIPPGLLALSDLELATAFRPFAPGDTTPLEFVKYAYGVVPVPSSVVPRRTRHLYVYYEVHNLLQGDDGKTSFNVSYHIYRQPPGTDVRRGGSTLSAEILAAMEPVGLVFTEESTGVSAQNLVVKGGQLDIADLTAGRYVLLVEIEDLLAEATVSRYVPFSKARS